MTIALPPPIIEIMPLLQSLPSAQKLHIIHTLSDDQISPKPVNSKAENLAWEMGKDLFGSYHSGQSDLSQNAKAIAKQRIRQKYGKDIA